MQNSIIDIDHIDIDSLPLALINQHQCAMENFVPYQLNDDHIEVLLTHECHKSQAKHALSFLNKKIRFILCETASFDLWHSKLKIRLQYHQANSHPQRCDIIALCDNIISDCIIRKASDIHIEPQQNTIGLRMRIDGIMHRIFTLPKIVTASLIARFKVISELDTTEKRLPQDSRFSFKYQHVFWDCRINICPSQFGEKIVIRLLNSKQKVQLLESLGIEPQQLDKIYKKIEKPQGIILVTGPTGSGKTQTLYSILQHINKEHINISTIEDPIEINLPGITQIQIKPKINFDYNTILRALLRQDPDVIMVGEIRDKATADIAIRAAQTGHLVLSTLHTNSSLATISRLINMGISAHHLAYSINTIIAQRLLRRLCPHCKCLDNNAKNLPLLAQLTPFPPIYKAQGCNRCHQGYKGRIGVFEILFNQKELSAAINAYPQDPQQLLALHDHLITLSQAALTQVMQGTTSVAELYRVIASYEY